MIYSARTAPRFPNQDRVFWGVLQYGSHAISQCLPLPYTNMNRHTPTAQTSAGKGANGLLLRPHISGAMKAGVPMVVVISEVA